jgi:hypothetical protein
MPRVHWGIKAADVDDFDRDKQYKPYDGPIPVNGVYQWQIKVLKFIAGSREKHPQLRIGLELIPRASRKGEAKYKGYFIMEFAPVTSRTAFRYAPFLDAIGVTGRDFETRTVADEEGNIRKIGKWSNDGKEMILAELKDDQDQQGNPRKAVGWMGAVTEDADEVDDDSDEYDDDDSEEYDDDEYDDDDYDDED